ncbi:type I-D CRISPR-associated protein Cas5/Csc1 [Fulvivirga maritima]|uniref:type I-D CRISPR-associated protein Cas5/Csc1 n=1 Tax=Fulvivirga maritima TaxID=2904247 RepID=UPI001F3CC604|nr:type I-D CRISPR-associated protein Cas5/Csc1 [Fulvivirga maritima]UII25133.1 type I-D CRISPR-associated protein Cas5/Csc1 [Fulvivirga maritima]
MEAQVIRLSLMSHLFYFTEVSGGSTSAAVTGDFLGDLALNYAIRNALGQRDYTHRKKPEYAEIADFGFYCTVARPVSHHDKTEAYIQNTLFNVDGYIDVKAIENSGKSPFKNFRQVQGIRLGSEFEALVLSEKPIALPPVIRMGRALETMVVIEKAEESRTQDFWLNAFSLKTVFNNLNIATALMLEKDKVNFSFLLENYNLIKQMNKEDVLEIFKPVFNNG